LRFRGRNSVPIKRKKKTLYKVTYFSILGFEEENTRKKTHSTTIKVVVNCSYHAKSSVCLFGVPTFQILISEEFGELTIKCIVLWWMCGL